MKEMRIFVIDFNKIKTAPTYPNLADHSILSMLLINWKVLYSSSFQCTIKLQLKGIPVSFTLSFHTLFLIVFVGKHVTIPH